MRLRGTDLELCDLTNKRLQQKLTFYPLCVCVCTTEINSQFMQQNLSMHKYHGFPSYIYTYITFGLFTIIASTAHQNIFTSMSHSSHQIRLDSFLVHPIRTPRYPPDPSDPNRSSGMSKSNSTGSDSQGPLSQMVFG